jgi:hypothetical protein
VRWPILLHDHHLFRGELIRAATVTAAAEFDDNDDGQQQRAATLACPALFRGRVEFQCRRLSGGRGIVY